MNSTDPRMLDWVENETLTMNPHFKPWRPNKYALSVRNAGYGYNWYVLEQLTSQGWEPFTAADQGTIYLRKPTDG